MTRTLKSFANYLLTPLPGSFARSVFWLGCVLLLLGLLIDFAPGAEAVWYALTAVFLAGGLFGPRAWYYRAAVTLIICCAVLAVAGVIRQYRTVPRQHPIFLPAPSVHRPNNALQRTGIGGRLFSVFLPCSAAARR